MAWIWTRDGEAATGAGGLAATTFTIYIVDTGGDDMRAAVSKWGNSLAVRIPKEAADAAGLQEGAALDLTVENGAVTLRRRRYDIRELVAGIKGSPPPLEFEDAPRGSEVW